VESQKAKAGRFLASHSASSALPSPNPARLFAATGRGAVILGALLA